MAAAGAVLPGRRRRVPALPPRDHPRRRLRRAPVPHAPAAARGGRPAHGAGLRRRRSTRSAACCRCTSTARATGSGPGATPGRPPAACAPTRRSPRPPISSRARSTAPARSTSPADELATVWEELGEMQAPCRRGPQGRRGVQPRTATAPGRPGAAGTAHVPHRLGVRAGRAHRARRRAGAAAACGPSTASPAREASNRSRAGCGRRSPAALRQRGRAAEAVRLFREADRRGARGRRRAAPRPGVVQPRPRAVGSRAACADVANSELALEIYTRAGDAERQAAVLNNLGIYAYCEGRWPEAYDFYSRAAEASERAGDVWAAAYDDCNIGELLADQGRLDEAQERLRAARGPGRAPRTSTASRSSPRSSGAWPHAPGATTRRSSC